MAKDTIQTGDVLERTGQLADVRTNDTNDLRMALARAVAGRNIPDEAISAVAKKLSTSKFRIRGIDVCAFGICIDYFFDSEQWHRALPELVRGRDARVFAIEAFPWGIPYPDLFRIRVQQEFDEFAAFGPGKGAQTPGSFAGGRGGVMPG